MTQSRGWLTRSAAVAGIAAALIMLALKGWAAWHTGSAAMLGSLADTMLDLAASFGTLVGVWVAATPPDDNHRFGHGKAEAIAALFQIVLISISAIAIAGRSLERIFVGGTVRGVESGIAVSAIAIVLTFALIAWQRHVIRHTDSIAIRTDSAHYQSDLFLNLAVIAALVLEGIAGIHGLDGLFGLGIAAWLGWGAVTASGEVMDQLMDHEWPEEKKRRFNEVLARNPDITGVHDLKTRTSGDRDFVQFSVWMDPHMPLKEAHAVMDVLEARLQAEFPDVEIVIHPEPAPG